MKWVLGVCLSAQLLGCAEVWVPNSPYQLAMRRYAWTTERNEWMFSHCYFAGAAKDYLGGGRRASTFLSGANIELELDADTVPAQLRFACPDLPPWPREDLREVHEAAARAPGIERQLSCKGSEASPLAVQVTRAGAGPVVGPAAVVRARILMAEAEVPASVTPMFHGRAPEGDEETKQATRLPARRLQYPGPPLLLTGSTTCFPDCLPSALPALPVGSAAEVRCPNATRWEVEIVAAGEALMSEEL
ncbi:MAG: hypothetical protein U1E65_21305 [Myxococcota bacterium]